jgi:hypothetical protein
MGMRSAIIHTTLYQITIKHQDKLLNPITNRPNMHPDKSSWHFFSSTHKPISRRTMMKGSHDSTTYNDGETSSRKERLSPISLFIFN